MIWEQHLHHQLGQCEAGQVDFLRESEDFKDEADEIFGIDGPAKAGPGRRRPSYFNITSCFVKVQWLGQDIWAVGRAVAV